KISTRLVKVTIERLNLKQSNTTIRHKPPAYDETEIEDWLWREEGTKSLFNEIKHSAGLSEKPIIDSTLTVIEGNRRIVCLRRLNDQAINGELPGLPEDTFATVQCFMIPADTNPQNIDLLVARVHGSGKKEWTPLSQAEQIFDMVNKHSMPRAEVASALSLSPQRIQAMFEAYQATLEYGNAYRDDEGKWIHKFSYFYELFRRPALREWAEDSKNLIQFMELISGEKPRLSVGSQVRELGAIIANKRAYGRLLDDGFERAFEVLKGKQAKMDRYTKTLQEASEALLELTRQPKLSKDPRKVKVLGTMKERLDYLLSKDLTKSQNGKANVQKGKRH